MRIGSRFLSFIALFLFLAGTTSVGAGDFASALSALDQFSSSGSKSARQDVIGLVGFYGQPEPPQWLVLQDDESTPGLLREFVVSDGKVVAERTIKRLPNQDLPTIPLVRKRLKIDSGRAFSIATEVARENQISFDRAHFQLRCRELNEEPVWMLRFINRRQVTVGNVYISAESGDVLRVRMIGGTVGKFSSAVEAERP